MLARRWKNMEVEKCNEEWELVLKKNLWLSCDIFCHLKRLDRAILVFLLLG